MITKIQCGKFKFVVCAMALALSTLLSACAQGPDYAHLPPVPAVAAPKAFADNLDTYRVQIGDVLDIGFYLNPEFNETVTVRPDGMISTKVVEQMSVYNKTIPQINKALKKQYKRDLKDPAVSTIVRSFAPIHIYVSGEVNAPGEYVVVGQALTLTQAIARAGGIKNSGVQDKVLIIRRGEGNSPKLFVGDYYAATQKADFSKDARLSANDVVFVPRSGVALSYAAYQQHLQQFIAPGISAGYSIK